MRMTPRELVLLLVTIAVGLFGVTFLLLRPQLGQWKEVSDQKDQLRLNIVRARQLMSGREQWAGQLGELSRLLPQFPADTEIEAHWLSLMDATANRTGVKIEHRQVGEEQRVGDIYELPIESRSWTADLESLVQFLFELQNQGAMLDVRHLLIKSTRNGMLRGRFTLSCAYMRAPAGAETEAGRDESENEPNGS